MDGKFTPTLKIENGYTSLKLKGILDEDNTLAALQQQIQGRLLLIDMSELERINSCGVRDWVNWLNQIQALGTTVYLYKCSPVVVAQANMVANFTAGAFIHSFYAPYVHPDTGEEQNVLIFTENIRDQQPVRAPRITDAAGDELEFDEFEESYFAFLGDPLIKNFQVPPDIQAILVGLVPGGPQQGGNVGAAEEEYDGETCLVQDPGALLGGIARPPAKPAPKPPVPGSKPAIPGVPKPPAPGVRPSVPAAPKPAVPKPGAPAPAVPKPASPVQSVQTPPAARPVVQAPTQAVPKPAVPKPGAPAPAAPRPAPTVPSVEMPSKPRLAAVPAPAASAPVPAQKSNSIYIVISAIILLIIIAIVVVVVKFAL